MVERRSCRDDLPSIVFSHVPLDGSDMTGLLLRSRSRPLALHGYKQNTGSVKRRWECCPLCRRHVHWNKLNTVDGIPYLSLQSLTESFTTAPDPAGAWSTIQIIDKFIGHVTVPMP